MALEELLELGRFAPLMINGIAAVDQVPEIAAIFVADHDAGIIIECRAQHSQESINSRNRNVAPQRLRICKIAPEFKSTKAFKWSRQLKWCSWKIPARFNRCCYGWRAATTVRPQKI